MAVAVGLVSLLAAPVAQRLHRTDRTTVVNLSVAKLERIISRMNLLFVVILICPLFKRRPLGQLGAHRARVRDIIVTRRMHELAVQTHLTVAVVLVKRIALCHFGHVVAHVQGLCILLLAGLLELHAHTATSKSYF